MSVGGYRPGAGRKKGQKDSKPRKRKDGAAPPKPKRERKPAPPPVDDLKERVKKLLEAGTSVKAKAFRDLASKLQQGQALTSAEIKTMVMLERELTEAVKEEKPPGIPLDIATDAAMECMTPLDYMLHVMRDKSADKDRRDRMACEAAKYMHTRMDVGVGKKESKNERAKAAGSGKFAPAAPPLMRVK
ncbi:MAG: hypothetical protein ABIJ57_13660 [Pseudomonadota bacterium]